MKLSSNFSLRELTKSQTADRKGIDNTPTEEHIENPFKTIVIPDLVGQVSETVTATTPVATAPLTTGFIGQGNINIDPVTRLTASEEVLLDPLEKRFVKNRRTTNTRLT